MTKWVDRARTEGTPFIDGERITFVWTGGSAPTLRSDITGWWRGATPWKLTRAGRGVWTYSLDLPTDAYLEYGFFVGAARVRDPFNPRLTPNGMGAFNNYVRMPQAPSLDLSVEQPGVPVGHVTGHELIAPTLSGGRRGVNLYQPAAPGPYPLLVVFDGRDYLERARLPTILDNMIHQGQIRPLAAALIDSHPEARLAEYGCSEVTVHTILEDVLPWVKSQIELDTTPGAFGVAGASMGGLISLYVALRRPDLFGRVLSQSGAFGWGGESVVFNLLRQSARQPLRIYQSVGTYEWLLDINRRLREVVVEGGHALQYHEFHAGHNYPAWTADLPQGLRWLYGA